MSKLSCRVFLPAVIVAAVLSACGGGNGGDLVPTPVAATLTVSNATSPSFNGVYTTDAVQLTDVVKVDPIGSQPEVCSFKFSGPAGPNGQVMSGDIRYIPGTEQLHTTFISIGAFEFRSDDPTNSGAQGTNNRVVFTNKVFNSSTGVASSITLSGIVPLRGGRPQGC
jgi:hypothetical protein